ncbi:MAG: tRNA pseudouridine(38-40) synthase TruA [Anaerovoracaceae bacterium]|jgi:tRNA pseudouridine38-40 synthase
MKNILLTISYDGTPYSGWQRQPDARTVQGETERVLSELCGFEVSIDGTSRTDAGVHALGQCATFSGDIKIPTDRICLAANNLLPESIRLVAAEEVPEHFHARFDSKGKTYVYKIIASSDVDPFLRNYYYFAGEGLDTASMREAAAAVLGTHDFKSFEASGSYERKTTVRTISGIDVKEKDAETPSGRVLDEIDVEVTGDGFLYNMVRIIAGTLVDVGRGKINAGELPHIIEGKDRALAGHTAPPQGLYLKKIFF